MAIQSELLYREDLPISLRISGLSGKIRTSEDYNQVLDALLKGSLADPAYYQQQYSQYNSGEYPPAAGGMGDRAYMDREAANYKNYVQNKLKDLGLDRPQPSPLEEGRNPKPATPQPVQEPLKPSYSSIEVATPKETESEPNESKLTSPESYLSNFVDNLGKEETVSDETMVAGPGYIDEDDAFDNPYYTDPVPDLDDDSDFPDLEDLGLAQATQSNFQKLLNRSEEVAQLSPQTEKDIDAMLLKGLERGDYGKGPDIQRQIDSIRRNMQKGTPGGIPLADAGGTKKSTNEQRIAAFRESLLAQARDESPRTRLGPRGERATFSPIDRRRPDDKPFAQEERKPVKEDTRQSFDVQEKRLARASKDDYRRKQADPIDPMRRGAIFG